MRIPWAVAARIAVFTLLAGLLGLVLQDLAQRHGLEGTAVGLAIDVLASVGAFIITVLGGSG